MKKRKLLFLSLCIAFTGMASAWAGSVYSGYSTTVGANNGNGYTSYQTKAIAGANGNLKSGTVGGSYVVDARMQESDGTVGEWTRNMTDATSYVLDGHVNHAKGDSVRVHFSNDWNTFVDVQVTGSWRSN